MIGTRITPDIKPKDGIAAIRKAKGFYVTNTARDLSQADFKNRILPHTDLLVAEDRDAAGYFTLEITGGASIHVDMLRKQINPFERLKRLREKMPRTMFQTLVRGVNLFGYRPYPDEVIRLTVKTFGEFVDVWRVFDFLNHVPNMVPVFEEVKRLDKYLEPAICFSTGPEHTDEYYVAKVAEILEVTGTDIILAIKNHSGLGSPERIGNLVKSILDRFPDLIIHYHGHNTDGNDTGRIIAAVRAGAKIFDASDHALTGYFGPPPALTAILALKDEGYEPAGIDVQAIIDCNEKLKKVRPAYATFESQFKGFDPTVHIHKLPGGAMGSSFEQAVKGGFLDRMPEILLKELPRVHRELGNFWSVTPGSQILWTTAVSHTLTGVRYENASEDLKRLLLERYGPFPFHMPSEEIYLSVFGAGWKKLLYNERGRAENGVMDLVKERADLDKAIARKANDEEFVLYLQHPRDAVEFFKFEQEYGRVYVIPPEIWLKEGGFDLGQAVNIADYSGKRHQFVFGPSHTLANGEYVAHIMVDHHMRTFTMKPEEHEKTAATGGLSVEQIMALAEMGEIRALSNGVIAEVEVQVGDEVEVGDLLLVMEAMKMLSRVTSPIKGVVKEIAVAPSKMVKKGDLLIKIGEKRTAKKQKDK